MALSTRTSGILISVVLSVGMISAAYFLSSSSGPAVADAESTEALLKAYASLDTDGDNLMDWQEKLYGTDPANPHTLDATLTDRQVVDSGKVEPLFASETEAVSLDNEELPGIEVGPETLTDRFARQLFTDYLTGGSKVPTEDDLLVFVDSEIDALVNDNSAKSAYGANNVSTVPGGADALRAYAVVFERIIAENSTDTDRSELEYFADAVHGRSTDGLETVRTIGKAYTSTAKALTGISVPTELRATHVRIVNALSRMGTIVTNMAEFEKDPLLSFVSISSYEATITDLAEGFEALYPSYASANISFNQGEAGASFLLMLQIIASQMQN